MALRRFTDDEIVISRNDAWKLLQFFFNQVSILPASLTNQDISFAQALLLDAADRSYEMGYAQILFENFFMASPRSLEGVRDLLKEFIKAAAKHWWNHATEADLMDAKLYLMVVNQLRRNFRSTWLIREQTGELIY